MTDPSFFFTGAASAVIFLYLLGVDFSAPDETDF